MVKCRSNINFFRYLIVAMTLIPVTALSQTNREKKKIFSEAEANLLYEEYELANQYYLLLDSPDNFNVKYKIGLCYLNIPGKKDKAIAYLQAASNNVSPVTKPNSFKEVKAPVDSYFYLAKAYMINGEPEKGLNTLWLLRDMSKVSKNQKGVLNQEFIQQQISACKNILELKNNPVYFDRELVGKMSAPGSVKFNPVVSFDGKTMVFTEMGIDENKIFIIHREGDRWTTPVNITSQLHAGGDCSSCSLNNDGTELFIYMTGNFDGAIFSSKFVNGKWSPMKKLNSNINSKFYESSASVSADGKKLYFASNRNGGKGALDIFVSERAQNGDWGEAKNLGEEINTQFNEDTPFVTENDSLLFFASEGHITMGGYDIFKSRRKGDVWSEPVNLGYPFNTPDDDKFFQPAAFGKRGYYAVPTDYKREDIFMVNFEKANPLVTNPGNLPPATNNKQSVITDVKVVDVKEATAGEADNSIQDPGVLYYTVQLIALHRPVDVTWFKNDANDIRVMYTENDNFYRYTIGKFQTRAEAESYKEELLKRGYSKEIFIKAIIK